MKKIIAVAAFLVLACGAWAQTATKYFVAHQGGYVGEATVTIDPKGNVVSATIAEWQGPGGWAEFNAPDGKSTLDGYVVRVPDPLANPTASDPMIRGYMFYVYNLKADGTSLWSQFTPGKDGFTRPTRQYERDFEGLMSNPIRAQAYAEAARNDTLVSVTIDGTKVTLGKKASETVHYGHMNKADPRANYMPLNASSIGYRYNNRATLAFFKANPRADFASATLRKAPVTLKADPAVDPAKVDAYTAADDQVYAVADVVTGATYSDFQHYSLELQNAYKMALAQLVK